MFPCSLLTGIVGSLSGRISTRCCSRIGRSCRASLACPIEQLLDASDSRDKTLNTWRMGGATTRPDPGVGERRRHTREDPGQIDPVEVARRILTQPRPGLLQ